MENSLHYHVMTFSISVLILMDAFITDCKVFRELSNVHVFRNSLHWSSSTHVFFGAENIYCISHPCDKTQVDLCFDGCSFGTCIIHTVITKICSFCLRTMIKALLHYSEKVFCLLDLQARHDVPFCHKGTAFLFFDHFFIANCFFRLHVNLIEVSTCTCSL